MKYIRRIKRWLKCFHEWKKYDMSDPLLPTNVVVYDVLDPNRDKVMICRKCHEIRSCGKKADNLWTW